MIQLEDAESVVRDHLERRPHRPNGSDEDQHSAACYFMSEALTMEIPPSTSDINIKIADFGVASWVDNHLTDLIQPPSLRAPEVILRAGWDTSADIWSAACVIFELLQGRILFKGRPDPNGAWTAEEDHLAQMIELFGPLPAGLLTEGSSSRSYFDRDGMLKLYPFPSRRYANPVAIAVCATSGNMLHIHQIYPSSLEQVINYRRNPSLSDNEVPRLKSFLQSMLQYRPEHRPSAGAAAMDPWLQICK
ncbi:hypothetical protein MMC11_001584 [Xylographa trunciseda]|nr:hypothetical protein [Xylographa trunciseda]